jgi:hypothetical protein
MNLASNPAAIEKKADFASGKSAHLAQKTLKVVSQSSVTRLSKTRRIVA